MKKLTAFLCGLVMAFLLCSCENTANAQIAATTLPVYNFTQAICENTGLQVVRLINEEVSCLHDYTLQISQMQAIERSEVVILSGAGLEDFLELPQNKNVIDASYGIPLLEGACHHEEEDHHHEEDPHIWLSPRNAMTMAENICAGLVKQYPGFADTFNENLKALLQKLEALDSYGTQELSSLSTRELITFHDGFAYLAECYDLTILEAIEEESGSEASASELIELIGLIEEHNLTAVFTERNGSTSAASVLSRETGVKICTLDMAMAGDSYFDAMYRNIDTLKEALQ
ncbi:MAG: zinc ABC transporter substrate-binding protein [Oscillospiraceae bacterium]|nr:zinc ABC transporter substrate-binding protein [Oscillospiraceae bacterium]